MSAAVREAISTPQARSPAKMASPPVEVFRVLLLIVRRSTTALLRGLPGGRFVVANQNSQHSMLTVYCWFPRPVSNAKIEDTGFEKRRFGGRSFLVHKAQSKQTPCQDHSDSCVHYKRRTNATGSSTDRSERSHPDWPSCRGSVGNQRMPDCSKLHTLLGGTPLCQELLDG